MSEPQQISVLPGVIADIKAPGDSACRFWASDGVQLRQVTDQSAVAVASSAGTYTILCWTVKDGRPFLAMTYLLVVGGGTVPGWKFPKIPLPNVAWLAPVLPFLRESFGPAVLALVVMFAAGQMKGCSLPPIPWPTPGPGPTPEPPPIPIGKLRVLVVLDKANVAKLPRGQQDIIGLPKDLRDYLNSHCGVGEDGKTPEFRFFDYQQDVSGSSAAWKAGMAKAQGKPLPFVVIANETAQWEGSLPASKDELLTILRKYGGP